ncbi:MAG: futalosine hydrolase [Saprospiraceae bacterium]|nr:MAG: futalosine hydrolase [Saprospiraceae bacterium]
MKILITAATPFELAPLRKYLTHTFEQPESGGFSKNELEVYLTITGIGMAFTAYHLGSLFANSAFDLAINAGIAGAFDKKMKLGEVVHVVSERFGDLGAEDAGGTFTSIHELDLIEPFEPPFRNGELINPSAMAFDFLPKCSGLTVNKVHGSAGSIAAIRQKYPADVESMEGAAFFYACLMTKQPFLEIRSISNYVEPRNREAWNLPLAIDNLNNALILLLDTFE